MKKYVKDMWKYVGKIINESTSAKRGASHYENLLPKFRGLLSILSLGSRLERQETRFSFFTLRKSRDTRGYRN